MPASGAGPAPVYPFEVTFNGYRAAVKDSDATFATVPQSIPNDATIAIPEKAPVLIVNATPCKENGEVLAIRPILLMVARDTKEIKLHENLEKQMLDPGMYLMNVVANGQTSRILVRIVHPQPE